MLKVKKIDEEFRKDLVKHLNSWKTLPRIPEYNLRYPWSGIECALGEGNCCHKISISTDRVNGGVFGQELMRLRSYANDELFSIGESIFHLQDGAEYVIGRECSGGFLGPEPVYCMSNDGIKTITDVKCIRNYRDWTLSGIQLYMKSDPGKEPNTHNIGIYNIGLGNLDVKIDGYEQKTRRVINLEL